MPKSIYAIFILLLFAACSDDLSQPADGGGLPIQLTSDIEQVPVTRVNDSGFCNGDMIGIYVTDYDGLTPGTLHEKGNRGDNVRYTFDEENQKWVPAYNIYYKDKHTPVDIYGYYPYNNDISNITDNYFEVKADQAEPSG